METEQLLVTQLGNKFLALYASEIHPVPNHFNALTTIHLYIFKVLLNIIL
jgi:hypothetical protein